MIEYTDKEKKEIFEAEKVIGNASKRLAVNLRYMDAALLRLKMVPSMIEIGTDGEHIFYDPYSVLKRNEEERTWITHTYLHMIMHCIYRHFYIKKDVDERLWNLASDIAVEGSIIELNLQQTAVIGDLSRKRELQELKRNVKYLTAEYIYRYLKEGDIPSYKIKELETLFRFDNHDKWYELKKQEGRKEEILQNWEEISEKIQTDLETFRKENADIMITFMQNLKEVNRDRYDYTEFLRKFAKPHEELKLNTDEFDYIFYTYGLKLYQNMPLIEPLEYREDRKVREFVIALDTSGSVKGDMVQKFVEKTFSILSSDVFSGKFNLHIIQCDNMIREDQVISSADEFKEYLKTMTLKGFSGTDFTPVFRYVDSLIKKKELVRPEGLIYLTDCRGKFPSYIPDYRVAFISVDADMENVKVPSWVIRLDLRSEEL